MSDQWDDMTPCPNAHNHTEGPDGYLAWHAWANRMRKTHVQKKCPGCGLYKIVVPSTAGAVSSHE